MLHQPTVMLDNLVLSLSDSLDLIHPSAVDHQQRVAYIALRIAKTMGHRLHEQADLMYASVLHDVGVLSVEEKIESMNMHFENEESHAEAGADLLRRFAVFDMASQLVRLHHRPWAGEARWSETSDSVRVLVNMLYLADHVDRFVKREPGILGQVKTVCGEVSRRAGKEFSPEVAECFLELAGQESFWLDFASPRIYSVLSGMVQWPRMELDLNGLEQIGKIFCRIVDFRSGFTATHSAGVATVAQKLAKRMHFSERECRLMLTAGYLHDLGKVAVPNSILDKPGNLDSEEFDVIRAHTYHTYHILTTIGGFEEIAKWASFHHERLNGQGYPFHLKGEEIPLGSRIMCVADVFTALTENRPYRKGTNRDETLPILQNMVVSGSLDESIVGTLVEDYEEIDRVRASVQEVHAIEYTDFMGQKTGAGHSPSRI